MCQKHCKNLNPHMPASSKLKRGFISGEYKPEKAPLTHPYSGRKSRPYTTVLSKYAARNANRIAATRLAQERNLV